MDGLNFSEFQDFFAVFRYPGACDNRARGGIMFKNLNIRYKLLASYWIVFILSLSLGSVSIYAFVRKSIEANISSELHNTTNTILNMVKTSAAVSIKNHLRAIAEKNNEIVDYFFRQYLQGLLTEEEAKRKAAEILQAQTIGQSGYIYCLNSEGRVLVHPLASMLGANVSSHDFVQHQIKEKGGYSEYEWKNPDDDRPRPKAIYTSYFAPWDWILSVSAYRTEFKELVNVDDFKDSILSLRFGETGYSYVLDSEGTLVIHPKLQGVNVPKEKDLPHQFTEEMLAKKQGQMIYPWKNPGESAPRRKLVIFNYIPEYEWIVASSSYLEEFYEPLSTVRNMLLATIAATLMLALPITLRLSASITTPLKRLTQNFESVVAGNFTFRMERSSNDEVGQLATYFNSFMDQLESYSTGLNEQIRVRKKAEEALRESEERYRTIIETAPDPIAVYDMEGRITLTNPAFYRTFGWTLRECRGKRLHRFVPEENWPETKMVIDKVLAGAPLPNIETRRYTKAGDPRNVSITGATHRDRNGQLAGTVMLFRDITEKKRLEKQVMDIGDRERQKIGQDLHDDLCPHLIGVQGLCTVLKENLSEWDLPSHLTSFPANAGRNHELSNKILKLIEDAIAKSRGLARGLCPVHLVSHGLSSALKEMATGVTQAAGIPCRFRGDDSEVLLENTEATHIYYIAREAANNAVKHAGATGIDIALCRSNDTVHLSISDDGRGIPENSSSRGMGLAIMQYRARMIGATIAFYDGDGGGATVHVSMKNRAPEAET